VVRFHLAHVPWLGKICLFAQGIYWQSFVRLFCSCYYRRHFPSSLEAEQISLHLNHSLGPKPLALFFNFPFPSCMLVNGCKPTFCVDDSTWWWLRLQTSGGVEAQWFDSTLCMLRHLESSICSREGTAGNHLKRIIVFTLLEEPIADFLKGLFLVWIKLVVAWLNIFTRRLCSLQREHLVSSRGHIVV
jgi:hypothetical protein